MRWVLISILITVPTLAATPTASAAGPGVADERAILQLRDELYKAYDAGDVNTFSKLEEDGFTLAADFGQVTKQQHLEQVRHREKAQVVAHKIDNQFRVYGDVAFETEVDHASDAQGKADDQTTIVWVRHGNTWQVALMHYSKINDTP